MSPPVIGRRLRALILALISALWIACGSNADDAPPKQLEDLFISLVAPDTLVPGSVLVVEGNFIDLEPVLVELEGVLDGVPVNALLPASLPGLGRLEVKWTGGYAMGLPANQGMFTGTLRVRASIPADPREHLSPRVPVGLRLADQLEPKLYGVQEGMFQVNDLIAVEGADLLLGGDEGVTLAVLEGCFQKQGETACLPFGDVTVPVTVDLLDASTLRKKGSFPFAPKIAGIRPGLFSGTVRLRNVQAASGPTADTPQKQVQIQILPSTLTAFSPAEASLGQYVEISGGGFVGKGKNGDDPTPQTTRIQLVGTFTAAGAPGKDVSLELITEFVSGKRILYVLNEEDSLGQAADLRTVTGQFKGTAKPIVSYGSDSVTGPEIQVSLGIAPLKQIVWLNWLPTYRKSLENLGLRAADQRIRDRIVEAMNEAYVGINVEFRVEEPRDFKLYAQVDFEGPDPNGLGLLGYDNTAGKDKGNVRLADKIGGVNALTQEGGFPGYGGVFVDSLFGFSQHPGKFAEKIDGADPLFDQIFDPFRPDRGGKPILADELAVNVPILSDGNACPAPSSDRKLRIACAVWVLGSMIGTTAAHEVAHSLGLADPEGEEFHNSGDEPSRLMDSGGARSFRERAQVGEAPGIFCTDDYAYLKKILPTPVPDNQPFRPQCY